MQNNPVNANDPMGLDPLTGQPNSTLQCHVNTHWDYSENLKGAVGLTGLATAGFAPELLAGGSNLFNYIQGSLPYTTAMVAAGSKTGQNILNEIPDFIDSWMPAESPPQLSKGGLTGYVTKSLFDFVVSDSSSYTGLSGGTASNAAGGFVIYPNKANLNMMKSVYAK